MNCPLCTIESSLIVKNHQGFLPETSYDIYSCSGCNTQFIDPSLIDEKIYEKIYSDTNTSSYSRYLDYAIKIKSHPNPLLFLAEQEASYFPAYQELNHKSKLDILEVGCGFGYSSYALSSKGNNVLGIDLSKNAIEFATEHFGPNYKQSSIFDFDTSRKFDYILANELIEHLSNPIDFLKKCMSFLKENGKIIITTPNKDVLPNVIWKTDLPPVHIFYFSQNSFIKIAEKINADVSIFDWKNYKEKKSNLLLKYFYYNKKEISFFTSEIYKPSFKTKIKLVLINLLNSSFFKRICNFVFVNKLINSEILCVILKNSNYEQAKSV